MGARISSQKKSGKLRGTAPGAKGRQNGGPVSEGGIEKSGRERQNTTRAFRREVEEKRNFEGKTGLAGESGFAGAVGFMTERTDKGSG